MTVRAGRELSSMLRWRQTLNLTKGLGRRPKTGRSTGTLGDPRLTQYLSLPVTGWITRRPRSGEYNAPLSEFRNFLLTTSSCRQALDGIETPGKHTKPKQES